jgi:hypothetical protein
VAVHNEKSPKSRRGGDGRNEHGVSSPFQQAGLMGNRCREQDARAATERLRGPRPDPLVNDAYPQRE